MRSRAMRKATRRYFWDRMKVSLWFVPLVMALGAVLLSWLLGRLDEQVPNQMLNNSKFFIAGSASEMRVMMIGIAGTVLATAGVVFSLLTLPLSTVAAQFGSRLLRIFMRDRTTQFVLGMFVATFTYCLATALSIPNVQTSGRSAANHGHIRIAVNAVDLCLVDHPDPAYQHHAPGAQYRGSRRVRSDGCCGCGDSDEASESQKLIGSDGQ